MFLKDLIQQISWQCSSFQEMGWAGVQTLDYACIHIFEIIIPNGKTIHILKKSKEIILEGSTVGQNSRS